MDGGSEKKKLRVFGGAGQGREIDADVVSKYRNRSVNGALTALIEDHILDPEVRTLLGYDRMAIELFGRDAGGEFHESPILPSDPFERAVELLQADNAELGIARSHAGGSSHRTRGRPIASRYNIPGFLDQ